MAKARTVHLPPHCGEALDEPYLHNPYLEKFQAARRLRFCLSCRTMGSMDTNCSFTCKKCATVHTSNLTAPRVFDRFSLLAGRGGGKTLGGAWAVREELMVPNSIWWAMGPTYKILHDSTLPTLVRRIPPAWVKRWDPEHYELTLTNNAMVAFRTLEDPERARGPHGVNGGWFDEAAQCPQRAYDVFTPTLLKAGGIVITTTTPLGFDWTYDEIEKRATIYKEPGYFHISWWSEENPIFRTNPIAMRDIERARKTMTPEFFGQEYRAERRNATGLVYDYARIDSQTLKTDKEIQRLIPEWPDINPSRPVIIGLDSGSDHPFGAVLIVATEFGLVIVDEYLERNKAVSTSLDAIAMKFRCSRFSNIVWAANKNEANLRLEAGLKGIGVVPAESKQEVGIQRVHSWLLCKKLFYTYRCPKTIEQSQAYRYAENLKPSGEKKTKEEVFKFRDELPDAKRYAIMAWPELPDPAEPDAASARLRHMGEKDRFDLGRLREYHARDQTIDLEPAESGYPVGDFFQSVGEWN